MGSPASIALMMQTQAQQAGITPPKGLGSTKADCPGYD